MMHFFHIFAILIIQSESQRGVVLTIKPSFHGVPAPSVLLATYFALLTRPLNYDYFFIIQGSRFIFSFELHK